MLTLDRLKRRWWFLTNRCFLCLEEEETIDHIFIHCVKTRVLWNLLFSLLGVLWILPSLVRDTLLGWHGSFVGKRRKKVCGQLLFACFGPFGRKETKEHLRMRNSSFKD